MKTIATGLAMLLSLAVQIPGFIGNEVQPPKMNVPEGFTPIFNGKDLSGWHVSKTNHHGITPDYHVLHGMIVGTQQPLGSGGILLTDRKYKNVEIYLEVKPDWGCDSGLFLRSDEAGNAYQVTLDYLKDWRARRDATARAWTRVKDASATPAVSMPPALWTKAWKREDWNRVRAADRRRRAARPGLDQRSASARLHRHRQSRDRAESPKGRSRSRSTAVPSAGSQAASGAGG